MWFLDERTRSRCTAILCILNTKVLDVVQECLRSCGAWPKKNTERKNSMTWLCGCIFADLAKGLFWGIRLRTDLYIDVVELHFFGAI